jgi:hypothetical protein
MRNIFRNSNEFIQLGIPVLPLRTNSKKPAVKRGLNDATNDFKPREAAAYLKTSTSTLAKRRLYCDSPRFTRIGRAIRYRKADLDEFMASSLVRSTSETVGR